MVIMYGGWSEGFFWGQSWVMVSLNYLKPLIETRVDRLSEICQKTAIEPVKAEIEKHDVEDPRNCFAKPFYMSPFRCEISVVSVWLGVFHPTLQNISAFRGVRSCPRAAWRILVDKWSWRFNTRDHPPWESWSVAKLAELANCYIRVAFATAWSYRIDRAAPPNWSIPMWRTWELEAHRRVEILRCEPQGPLRQLDTPCSYLTVTSDKPSSPTSHRKKAPKRGNADCSDSRPIWLSRKRFSHSLSLLSLFN